MLIRWAYMSASEKIKFRLIFPSQTYNDVRLQIASVMCVTNLVTNLDEGTTHLRLTSLLLRYVYSHVFLQVRMSDKIS